MHSLHVIAVAACIEVCVRDVIRTLVDSGSPYIDRIEKFKDLLRFDLELTKALSDRRISFGELVAHLLPISSVGQIASHLEALLSERSDLSLRDHLGKIRHFIDPSEEEFMGDGLVGQQSGPIGPFLVAHPDRLLADIDSIFRSRHIAAHEAHFTSVSKEQVEAQLQSARLFIDVMYESVTQLLRPGAPRSAFLASLYALQEAAKVTSKMSESLHDTLRIISSAGEQQFSLVGECLKAQEAYDSYMFTEIEFHQRLCRLGGNGIRHLDALLTIALSEKRDEFLRSRLEDVAFYSGLTG
jgi:hypothetical protein